MTSHARRLFTLVALMSSVVCAWLPAQASAAGCSSVAFKTRGAGTLLQEVGLDGATTPVTGGKLSFKGGNYVAKGVTVYFTYRGVKYTVRAGSVFKPNCFSVVGQPEGSGVYLTKGRVDVASRARSPKVHGVNTFEGIFYTTKRSRYRYTVRKSLARGKRFEGTSSLKLSRGPVMTLTPYSDIAPPFSCRRGRTVSINYKGRIRG